MRGAGKLDISDEFEEVLKSLDGNHDKVRCLLNKADQVAPQELFRVYGALLWSLGKVSLSLSLSHTHTRAHSTHDSLHFHFHCYCPTRRSFVHFIIFHMAIVLHMCAMQSLGLAIRFVCGELRPYHSVSPMCY